MKWLMNGYDTSYYVDMSIKHIVVKRVLGHLNLKTDYLVFHGMKLTFKLLITFWAKDESVA